MFKINDRYREVSGHLGGRLLTGADCVTLSSAILSLCCLISPEVTSAQAPETPSVKTSRALKSPSATLGESPHDSRSDDPLSAQRGEAHQSSEGLKRGVEGVQLELNVALYPRREVIRLEPSDHVSSDWGKLYLSVRADLSQATLANALQKFTRWRHAQTQLNERPIHEELLTQHADLLILLHDQVEYEAAAPRDTEAAQDPVTGVKNEPKEVVEAELITYPEELTTAKVLMNSIEERLKRLNQGDQLDSYEERLTNTLQMIQGLTLQDKQLLEMLSGLEGELSAVMREESDQAESIRRALSAAQLSALKGVMGERLEFWQQLGEGADELLRDSALTRVQIPTRLIELRRAHVHLTAWIDHLTQRSRVEREYRRQGREWILSQQLSLVQVVDQRWLGIEETQTALEREREALDRLQLSQLRSITPPAPIEESEGESRDHVRLRLKRARQAYRRTQKLIKFHQERQALTRDALERGEKLLRRVEPFEQRLNALWEKLIEYDVTQALTVELNRPLWLGASSIANLVRTRRSERLSHTVFRYRQHWRDHSQSLKGQLTAWREQITADQEAQERLSHEISREGGLKSQLEMEEAWVTFVGEIERLQGSALLARYQGALEALLNQDKTVDDLRKRCRAEETRYAALMKSREQLSDPMQRQYPVNPQATGRYISSLQRLVTQKIALAQAGVARDNKPREGSSTPPDHAESGAPPQQTPEQRARLTEVTPDESLQGINAEINREGEPLTDSPPEELVLMLGRVLPSVQSLTQQGSRDAKSLSAVTTAASLRAHNDQSTQEQRRTLRQILMISTQLHTLLLPRIDYYQEIERVNRELKRSLELRDQMIKSLSAELTRRVDLARQVRRAAIVIQQQVSQGALNAQDLTEERVTHTTSEWVNRFRSETVDALKRRYLFDIGVFELTPAYEGIAKTLLDWRDHLNEIITTTRQLSRSIAELGALTQADQRGGVLSEGQSQATLSDSSSNTSPPAADERSSVQAQASTHVSSADLNDRHLQHKLHERAQAEDSWYEFLWRSFHDERSLEIETLLRENYIELLKLEMKRERIKSHVNSMQHIMEHIIGLNQVLKRYQAQLTQLSSGLGRLLKRDRAAWEVRVGLMREADLQLPSALQESIAQERALMGSLEGESVIQKSIDHLSARWTLHQVYRAAVYEVNDSLTPQGIFAYIQGTMSDLISLLHTDLQQLARPMRRLLGDSTSGGLASSRDLGEIARLRESRREAKLRVLLLAIAQFLLIPLLVLLSLRAVTLVEHRIRARAEQDLKKIESEGKALSRQRRAEREDRLTTLLLVMRTSSRLVVVIIALGAMLKALYIDVTPILASAGIIGLALAFGAQELVRDFFSGVFILFENQYNRGDFVTINGIFGNIDRVTLRLTVVRDAHGAMHFIPNGQIQVVSNHNKEWSQANLEVGVAYHHPPQQVLDCLRRICIDISDDPVIGLDMLGWEVLGLERFDDSAVVYRVHLRTEPKEKWRVARHFRRRVLEMFAEEGIEIPYPHVTVVHPSGAPEVEPDESMSTVRGRESTG